jgi:hypothetical protein
MARAGGGSRHSSPRTSRGFGGVTVLGWPRSSVAGPIGVRPTRCRWERRVANRIDGRSLRCSGKCPREDTAPPGPGSFGNFPTDRTLF